MIRNHNYSCVAILFGEIYSCSHSLVERLIFRNGTERIITMRSEIHLTALNHKEESVFVFRQQLYSLSRHLRQRRLRKRISVNVISHIAFRKHRPYRSRIQSAETRHIFLLIFDAFIFQNGFHVIIHVFDSTAENDIHTIGSNLSHDIGILCTGNHMRSSTGRSRMADLHSNHETRRLVTENLGSFQNSSQRLPCTVSIDLIHILTLIFRGIH